MVEIEVRDSVLEQLKSLIQLDKLEQISEQILRLVDEPEAELSILLTDDPEIQVLNANYRGKDKATDVLSFPQQKTEHGLPNLLGDVVVSIPTTIKQAEEFEVSFGEELLRLLIHGVLHLKGYDHEGVSEDEALRMLDKEAEIFNQLLGLI